MPIARHSYLFSLFQPPFVAQFQFLIMARFKATVMNWELPYVSPVTMVTIWCLQAPHSGLVFLTEQGEDCGQGTILCANVSYGIFYSKVHKAKLTQTLFFSSSKNNRGKQNRKLES